MNIIDFSRIDKVYIAPGRTDMRKGIEGLAVIVQLQMKLDPFSNSLFLFCGKNKSVIKGLYWDQDGFLLLTKRLQAGKFHWPRNGKEAMELSSQQLRWLLEGLSIEQKSSIKSIIPKRAV